MGRTKRKYSSFLIDYKRSFKKPLFEVGAIMNVGFSDNDFNEEFKILYNYLWSDICSKYTEYKRMGEGLVKKGFKKRYFFPSPIIFLNDISKHVINKIRNSQSKSDYILSEEERIKKRKNLLINSEEKIKADHKRRNNNLKYIQEVKPKHSNYFMDEYFKLKHQNPQDVTSRYTVLLEASKYKCNETIQFLHKVNASERNFNLRQFAFRSLQKFGVKEVRLKKNRKGKKKVGDSLLPDKIETPTELLKHIYNSQLEKEKMYDLFLSHSSLNQDLLNLQKKLIEKSNEQIIAKQEFREQGISILKKSPIYHKFLEAEQGIKIKKEDWQELTHSINEAYTDFTLRLLDLYPMKTIEMQVCLLIKIGVPPTQIAYITSHTKQAITSIRKRLYKKAFNMDGSPEDWDIFISSM